ILRRSLIVPGTSVHCNDITFEQRRAMTYCAWCTCAEWKP
ncbi:unnamed protein product, partial [Heterotrigona itama]